MSEKKDISEMSGEELQSAVQGILKDPAFAKLIGELSGGAPQESAQEEKAAPASTTGIPQISPEMLSRLPQMMSALSPLVSGMRDKAGGKDGKDGASGGASGDAEKRKKLLAALRPYLSSQRKDAIDSILKVTEMTDLIGQFGVGKPREK